MGTAFIFNCNQLAELENNREGIGNLYWPVTLLSGLPFRRALDDADCLLVEGRIDTPKHFHVGHRTVLFNRELEGNTALDTILLGNLRIDEL